MALTMWIDDNTGRQLDVAELDVARSHAKLVYETNTHIFQDEAEALAALGVVPLFDTHVDVSCMASAA